jgi:hypothetical protein
VLLGSCVPKSPDTAIQQRECPRISFQEKTYNFEYAGPKQSLVHHFRFSNTGSTLLRIDKVDSDCGCVATMATASPVPPKGTGQISVTLETGPFEGPLLKNITVFSNDPEKPEMVLTIRGIIKRFFAIVPPEVNFGEVQDDSEPKRRIKLYQLSDDPLELKRVQAERNLIGISSLPFHEENSRGYYIDISLKKNVAAGFLNEVITLHTNLKRTPKVDVLVWANIHK